MTTTLLAVLLSYIVGSIPTGLWLGMRLRGIDIREHGSKNIGATNTLRVLGKKLGALALAGDVGKGIVATIAIARLSAWPYAPLVCGLAAIVGHSASAFLGMKGGKGVATSAGVFLTLCPIATLLAALVFFVVVKLTRMVSAGSICGALTIVASVFIMPHSEATYPTNVLPSEHVLQGIVTAVALLVIWKHRSNIMRILRGEENRI